MNDSRNVRLCIGGHLSETYMQKIRDMKAASMRYNVSWRPILERKILNYISENKELIENYLERIGNIYDG